MAGEVVILQLQSNQLTLRLLPETPGEPVIKVLLAGY
jgi:hypothetical protein